MFNQLFFVLLVMILINFTQEVELIYWIVDPKQAFHWALLLYAILLLGLFWQSYLFGKVLKRRIGFPDRVWINLELLFFLGIYHFGLGAQHFISSGILAGFQTPATCFSLLLYFLALGWVLTWQTYFAQRQTLRKAVRKEGQEVQFFLPFCLPFLALNFFMDGLNHLPMGKNGWIELNHDLILLVISAALLIGSIIFLPFLMMGCWHCRSLDQVDLKERLEKICTTLHFRHAGLKIWSILPHAFTAAIMGITPFFRYILFTPALLNRFRKEEIEAILVHEIGHHRYRHLMCYPFILLGMLVLGTLVLFGVESFFSWMQLEMSDFSFIMGLFLFYGMGMGFYFWVIFGFFSRLFERQADLYIFETSISPVNLIQALDRLGVVTGFTHSHPNWYHFSIQERIDFLHQAMDHPKLIKAHHQRVKRWVGVYFLLLIGSCVILFFFYGFMM